MLPWVRQTWTSIRMSYWFLPTIMAIGAVILAILTVRFDELGATKWIGNVGWMYTRGPEGARAILSTVAGSMITVAGVVFSITIVALSLASTQFGPRLLRNFVSDRGNQVVLGAFIATFVYCLLVLRTIRGQDSNEFVPHLSVTMAILLSLLSIGVLIFFIHHVASLIQAPNIIAKIGGELHEAIDCLYPEDVGESPKDVPGCRGPEDVPEDFEREAHPVHADRHGYVESIRDESLIQLAAERGLVVRLLRRPGQYVVKGGPLALVWPGSAVDEELASHMRERFFLGSRQTPDQDLKFTLNQLVEIAVRALSPGINDPFTAMNCLDYLGGGLGHLARKEFPSRYRCDGEGHLRIVAIAPSFSDLADTALDEIRRYAKDSVAVLVKMMEMIESVHSLAYREEDRAALRRHALLVLQCADSLPDEGRRAVQASFHTAHEDPQAREWAMQNGGA